MAYNTPAKNAEDPIPPVGIFDEWVQLSSLTKRLDPIPNEIASPFEAQRKISHQRLIEVRKMFLPNRSIDVYTDFITMDTCDAFAGIHRDLGCIAIAKGMILLPLEMFFRMLSHPLILPSVGNSSLERIGPQHRDGLSTEYDDLLKRRKQQGRVLLPKPPNCPIRHRVARVCADLMWRFVAMHELVHIVHGHIGYKCSVSPACYLRSMVLAVHGSSLSREVLDHHTMELWADFKAAQVVMGGLINKSSDSLHGIFDTPRARLFLWTFSLYTLFRLWGLKIDPTDLHGPTHPPTALRFELAVLGPCRDIAEPILERGDSYQSIVCDAQWAAEQAIVYCGGDALQTADVAGANHPAVQAHRDSLVDHFEKVLCNELKKHAYVKLET
jgi:hypothetical protein